VIALIRGVVGTLFLLIFSRLRKTPVSKEAIRKNLRMLIISGVAIGFNWILLFEAYRYTTVATATLCYYLAPVFIIIASPVGSYYAAGINPVRIMIETDDVRAVKGGTGYTKCGGNYAASNRAAARAEQKGYSQVLWLDGVHRKYIEEVGAMNVMFRIGDEIITPELSGSILPGITRKSCLDVLRNEGYKVSERKISVDELVEAMQNGTLKEAWGCGTAAVVSPIGELAYGDIKYTINNFEIGEITHHLYDTLTGIQWGKTPDSYGCTVEIPAN
jgi:branched-chain amino acid aminotransferase